MIIFTPEDVINCFDEILDYVFGRARGRDYPAKEDMKYASEWIDEGLTLPIACAVFYHRMSQMHEYWLRQADHKDTKNIPATLKFFDDSIRAGIRKANSDGEGISTWEIEESRWRARINGWIMKGIWNRDMFGPSPDEEGCRAPSRLLSEEKKKTALNK